METRTPRRSTLVLALALHLVALWPYLLTGLLAPHWAVLTGLAVWALLGVAAVAVHRRRGAVSALVPLAAVVLWVVLLTLGERTLAWVA